MKDEIKEILDEMYHIICTYSDDYDYFEENKINFELSYKNMEKLYDYITNLQEELEKYKLYETLRQYCKDNGVYNSECKERTIEALQKEHEFERNVIIKYCDTKVRIDKATKILNEGLKELDTRSRNEVYIEEYLENALDELTRK